jgi:hypothetical protein
LEIKFLFRIRLISTAAHRGDCKRITEKHI